MLAEDVVGTFAVEGPKLEITGGAAFVMGTGIPVDIGTTRFGEVPTGGTTAGVETLLKTGATGVFEGCALGAGAGAGTIGGFAALPGLEQLGAWFAVTVIHTVIVVVCVCGVIVTVTVAVCG